MLGQAAVYRSTAHTQVSFSVSFQFNTPVKMMSCAQQKGTSGARAARQPPHMLRLATNNTSHPAERVNCATGHQTGDRGIRGGLGRAASTM